ncbi:MAG: DUF951 domain-containing protein [Thermoanaerobacteraceae bacterium]|nr:DUF951 domain-containing protein [Thermoanaerobacteraceae bacterium]
MHRYQVGDVVRTRKPHPCGGDTWEIMRTGVDFRLKCTTCGRVVMLPRPKFEKSVRAVVSSTAGETGKNGNNL